MKGLKSEILTSEEGHCILEIRGKNARQLFESEHGTHQIKRIPPTEHNGRRHTSLVSVCVLNLPPAQQSSKLLPEHEFTVKFQRGHGPGGQNQNKVSSAVRMTHTKTGFTVFINGRDQLANRRDARRILSARVFEAEQAVIKADYQAGKVLLSRGGRGQIEKIRSYNIVEGIAIDHRTGKKTRDIKGLMKGNLELLK